ncbi:hypothetical protein Nepgr_014834 [Nepenthes gracilis]|uniref:Uncharacterized protein n=1 Tax=Nepenthes gracilis TaxID=150966 RepID=A0AAD3SK81_NEPGR|nr:hypothetical protein Nepgr_014834 [Nepenthes gracilis]
MEFARILNNMPPYLPNPARNDVVVWTADPSGVFSSKSAHGFFREPKGMVEWFSLVWGPCQSRLTPLFFGWLSVKGLVLSIGLAITFTFLRHVYSVPTEGSVMITFSLIAPFSRLSGVKCAIRRGVAGHTLIGNQTFCGQQNIGREKTSKHTHSVSPLLLPSILYGKRGIIVCLRK